MLYFHRFSIFDDPDVSTEDNKIKILQVQHSLQDTKKTMVEMQQSLDQQNKKSSGFQTAIEKNTKRISEIRQSQDQMLIGKNITTSLYWRYGIISIIFCLIIGLVLLYIICRIRRLENYFEQRKALNIDMEELMARDR
ncbi:unnamed protein product [Meloidogyne enterolobii]|uniref:Uncharacterized protein n=1 Tax=Meloidogyne enterolobii TaxID=390850 RepID=A0ACB1AT67_MELEN